MSANKVFIIAAVALLYVCVLTDIPRADAACSDNWYRGCIQVKVNPKVAQCNTDCGKQHPGTNGTCTLDTNTCKNLEEFMKRYDSLCRD